MKQFVFGLVFIGSIFIGTVDIFAMEQTVCPVMEGNPIKKDVFVEYKGQRVYFCCVSCKARFLSDPAKYLGNLPQFSVPMVQQHEDHNGHFSMALLVAPLGIATFILMFATLLAGVFMKRNRKRLFPWHRRLAVLTLVVAATHVLFVILAH